MKKFKRRVFFTFLIIFIGFLLYGVILSRYQVSVITDKLTTQHPEKFYDYAGAINVHTKLSTGSGHITEVIEAAQRAGLDFISYLDSRLLFLSLQMNKNLTGPGQAQVIFTDLLSRPQQEEGVIILAHPLKPGYQWTGDYPRSLDGIEIINLKSIWQKSWLHSKDSFFWTLFIYPFNPRLAFIRLFSEPKEEVQLWDKLNQSRQVFGSVGTDAEANFKLPLGKSIEFPSYEMLFSVAQNHLLLNSELTGDSTADHQKIHNAIKKGRFYMSLDLLADPKGFSTYMTSNEQVHPMGSKLSWAPNTELTVHIPQKSKVPFKVHVYKNGKKLLTSTSLTTDFVVHSPGVYRVVVQTQVDLPLPEGPKWIPWIYSNPFYVQKNK